MADVLDDILNRNNITQECAKELGITLDFAFSLLHSYSNLQDRLKNTANEVSTIIQNQCSDVHSIRFRVKNHNNLIDKIIRKKKDINNNKKYIEIDSNNYIDIIDDLIGVRVLHLKKEDFININWFIVNDSGFECVEKPTIYYKEGDDLSLYEKCDGFTRIINKN